MKSEMDINIALQQLRQIIDRETIKIHTLEVELQTLQTEKQAKEGEVKQKETDIETMKRENLQRKTELRTNERNINELPRPEGSPHSTPPQSRFASIFSFVRSAGYPLRSNLSKIFLT